MRDPPSGRRQRSGDEGERHDRHSRDLRDRHQRDREEVQGEPGERHARKDDGSDRKQQRLGRDRRGEHRKQPTALSAARPPDAPAPPSRAYTSSSAIDPIIADRPSPPARRNAPTSSPARIAMLPPEMAMT